MTKVHYIAIAIFAIILLVIFGHGSMDSLRKKQQERATKNLVNRIMKHNDPNYGKKPQKPLPRTNGVDLGGDTSADKMETDAPENNWNKRSYGMQNRPGIGSNRLQSQPQPAQNPPPAYQNQPAQQPQQAPANGDDYYPPTPADAARPKPQSVLQPLFHGNDGIALADGRMITFWGTKVFEIRGDGSKRPLKDGQYPLYNNTYIMTVRGGEQYIFE